MVRLFRRPWLRRTVLGAGVLFLALQAVPYGWSHPNPPVTDDAPWPSAEAARLARAACYDCHSNVTDWPLYSYVAPMSWLVRRDVEAGRDKLNFSTWADDPEAGEAAETIEDGSMPPDRYTMLHPDARLSDQERATLLAALQAMEGEGDEGDSSGPGRGRGRGRGRGGDEG